MEGTDPLVVGTLLGVHMQTAVHLEKGIIVQTVRSISASL